MSAVVRTTCPYCGVGCGVLARRHMDGRLEITGDPLHPANSGSLCSKGSALAATLGTDGRLLHPLLRARHGPAASGSDALSRRVGWDEALSRVAQGFRAVIREHGPDAV